jgi:thiamine biosynthesis lipoprotein
MAVDESVFTSGNYARFKESAETRYAHIIDPRSGWPVDRIMSATVIADHGWLADAAATSLIVAGLEEWKELSKALQIDKILLTDEQGNVYLTPQMLQRLDLSAGVEPIVINP